MKMTMFKIYFIYHVKTMSLFHLFLPFKHLKVIVFVMFTLQVSFLCVELLKLYERICYLALFIGACDAAIIHCITLPHHELEHF